MRSLLLAVLVAAVASACTGSLEAAPWTAGRDSASPAPRPNPQPTAHPDRPLPEDLRLAWEPVTDGLGPLTDLASPPGDPRLFAAARDGRVWIVDGAIVDGAIMDGAIVDGASPGDDARGEPELFLDVRGRVGAAALSDQGLHAMAFHPEFAANGRLFVHYTRPDGQAVVAEFRVSARDPDRATRDPVATLLTVGGVRGHGGGLAFGPDGALYVGLGDTRSGRGANRPSRAQDPTALPGSIVRLHPDRGEPEVFASGLHDPWSFSFDPVEDLLYIADVGRHAREEINVVPAGRRGVNLGWPLREAGRCLEAGPCPTAGPTGPEPTGPELTGPEPTGPIVAYPHDGGECAVVGGEVYTGEAIPGLVGHYLYTDLCGGWLRSFRHRDGKATDRRDWSGRVDRLALPTALAAGPDGELYAATRGGAVLRLAPLPAPTAQPTPRPGATTGPAGEDTPRPGATTGPAREATPPASPQS